jgi:hypothetical protein
VMKIIDSYDLDFDLNEENENEWWFKRDDAWNFWL